MTSSHLFCYKFAFLSNISYNTTRLRGVIMFEYLDTLIKFYKDDMFLKVFGTTDESKIITNKNKCSVINKDELLILLNGMNNFFYTLHLVDRSHIENIGFIKMACMKYYENCYKTILNIISKNCDPDKYINDGYMVILNDELIGDGVSLFYNVFDIDKKLSQMKNQKTR